MLALNRKLVTLTREAWDALQASPLNDRRYLAQLYRLALADEKDHRNFMGNFREYHPHAASVNDCAKQLCVTWLAKFVTGAATFHLKDLISSKVSVNYAASIAENYKAEILEAWKGFDLTELAGIDYVKMVSPEKEGQ
jgi:hypothetical protein